MELNWFTRAVARVVLASYVTQVFAPVVYACEIDTRVERLWGNGLRDPSPPREKILQRSFQQSLDFNPRVETLKSSSSPTGLLLDEDLGHLQAEAYQYRLRVKTLDLEREKFQVKLSRKIKEFQVSFENIHTSMISQGKLASSFSKAQEAQDDVLLSLFKGAAVHRFTINRNTICFSWEIGDSTTLKIARDGSVFFDQGSGSILSAYDIVLKTSGELFLESLGVKKLTLQSLKTQIIGSVVANHLHIDHIGHTAINEGGLQVRQLTGQGTLINHAILKLEGTTEKPALMGVHHLINEKNKGTFKEAKIDSPHIRITSENRSFFNGEGAEFKVSGRLTAGSSSIATASFINKGSVCLGQATLNREASNAGFWQTHQMTVNEKHFTNKGFGTLNILDALTITSELINEGDITAKNLLKVEKGVNKGTIKGETLFLETTQHFMNAGDIYLKALTGRGVFYNNNLLRFSTPDKRHGSISVAHFKNVGNTQSKTRAKITGGHILITNENRDVSNYDADIFVDRLETANQCSTVPLTYFINTGHIESKTIEVDSGPGKHQWDNSGNIKTNHIRLSGNHLIFYNMPKGTLQTNALITSASSRLDNRGDIHVNGTVYLEGFYTSQGSKLTADNLEIHKGGRFINALKSVVKIKKELGADGCVFQNDGRLKTQGKYRQSAGEFINTGLWEHTGDIILGETNLKNEKTGTLDWQGGKWDFKLRRYDNYGTWVFDRIDCSQQFTIHNHGVLHLKNGAITFQHIINHKNLILSAGQYTLIGGLQNNGEMLTEGKLTQKTGVFNNSGLWNHTGDIDLGSTELTNSGTMIWHKGKWDFTPTRYDNYGRWTLDQIVCSRPFTVHNHDTFHLKNSTIILQHIINHKHLIFSSGQYTLTGGLQNNNLMSFLENDWTFTDDLSIAAPNRLVFHDKGHFLGYTSQGEIEVEKNLYYDIQTLPKLMRSEGDIIFFKRHQDSRMLDDLTKVAANGKVSFYTKNITTTQDYEFGNIRYLDLYVDGIFTNHYAFKVRSLALGVNGSLTNGSSNTVMGTIAATQGPLTVIAHSYDGRFGKMYGEGPTTLKSTHGDIVVGSDSWGVDEMIKARLAHQHSYLNALSSVSGYGNFDYSTSVPNGAYVASGNRVIISSAKDLNLNYGIIKSGKEGTHLTAVKDILNKVGLISSDGSTRIEATNYNHVRGGNILKIQVVNSRYLEYPSSGPAILESLGDIEIFVNGQAYNMAGSMLSQESIFINGASLIPGTTHPTSYREDQLHYYYKLYTPKFFGGHWNQALMLTQSPTLKAGGVIQMNIGDVRLTGAVSAFNVILQAHSALFYNTSLTRQHVDTTKALFVNLPRSIEQEVSTGGFTQITANKEIREAFPSSKPYRASGRPLWLVTPENQHLYQMPLDWTRIINPLGSVSGDFINLRILSQLSRLAGKVALQGANGNNLKALTDRADEFSQETGKALVTEEELKKDSLAKSMMLYQLAQVGEMIHEQMVMFIDRKEINPYQSPGDVSADEFVCKTEGDQSFRNTRVVAKDILKTISTRGSVHRETEKYKTVHSIEDGVMIRENAMPQEQLICENGDVEQHAHLNLMTTGSLTKAGRDVLQTAETGLVVKNPLVLATTIMRSKKEDDGWVSTKTTSETSISHAIAPTTTLAGRNMKETAGQEIRLTGAKEIAGDELSYNGPSLVTNAAMGLNTHTVNSTTSGMFSERTDSKHSSTFTVEPTEQNARKITVNTDKADLRGTDFIALILKDNTRDGMKLGPTIRRGEYFQRSETSTPLSRSDVGCEGWYEVMHPCRLMVNQIIRNIDEGEIKLESVLWDKDRTEIIDKFAETTYELKKHHREWAEVTQIIPNEALVVVALAVGLVTQGMGVKFLSPLLKGVTAATGMQLSAMGAAMVNAGFSAVCAQSASSFGRTGDLLQVGKDLTSASSIRSLGITMLSAGLCQHIGAALDIDMNPGLTELINPECQVQFMSFLQANALKTVIETPLQSVIGQQPVEDTVLGGLKSLGINTVASYFAYHIGKIYGDKNSGMGYLEHKGVHGALGAAAGWLLNPTQKGLVSGAIGGVVSEVIMDERREIAQEKAFAIMAQAEKEGVPLEGPEFKTKLYESLLGELAFAKLSGATVAALLRQDPSVAFQTGSNAVENNAIMMAIGAGLATWEVYQIYKTYKTKGALAALELIAVDGVIILATAGGGKIAIALADITAFKAEWVWATYLSQNPAFAQVASKLADKVFTPVVAVASKGKEIVYKAKDIYNQADEAIEKGIAKIWQKAKEFSHGPKPFNPARQNNSESIHQLTEESRELFGILGENLSSTAESTDQWIVKGTRAARVNQIDPSSAETLFKLRQDLARFVSEGDRLNHPNPMVRNFAQNLKNHLEAANVIMPPNPTKLITQGQMRRTAAIQKTLERLKSIKVEKKDYYYGKNFAHYDGRLTVPGELPMKYRRHYAPPTGNSNRLNPEYQGLQLISNSKKTTVLTADKIHSSSSIIPLDKPGRFMFDGVEFRAVRDLNHITEEHLRKMYRNGINPLDIHGERLDGHHFAQLYHRKPGAFMAEVPEPNHCISNTIQHPLGKTGGLTLSERADWDILRIKFNKERAKSELLRRGLLDGSK